MYCSYDDSPPNTFFIAGTNHVAGGKAACAFVRTGDWKSWKQEARSWNSKVATFHALLAVVRCLPHGGEALVLTDSILLLRHWHGRRRLFDQGLRDISQLTAHLIQEKDLLIHLKLISRSRNLAWTVLADQFDSFRGPTCCGIRECESYCPEQSFADRNRNKSINRESKQMKEDTYGTLQIHNIDVDTTPRSLIDLFTAQSFHVLDARIDVLCAEDLSAVEGFVTMPSNDAERAALWAHGLTWRGQALEVELKHSDMDEEEAASSDSPDPSQLK